jgi:hypothetical protein
MDKINLKFYQSNFVNACAKFMCQFTARQICKIIKLFSSKKYSFLMVIVTNHRNSHLALFVSESSSEDDHAEDHLHAVPAHDENTTHHRVARSLPYYLSTKPPVSLPSAAPSNKINTHTLFAETRVSRISMCVPGTRVDDSFGPRVSNFLA